MLRSGLPMDNYEQIAAGIDYGGEVLRVRENEEALIGSVLRGGTQVYRRVAEIVKPQTFGNHAYGVIWNAIEKVDEAGLQIDTITVGDQLERAGQLEVAANEQWKGRALLSDLRTQGDPRNAESYAEIVQDYQVKRYLYEKAKLMLVWSVNGRRSADIMQDMSKLLGEITLYSGKNEEQTWDAPRIISTVYDQTTMASEGKLKAVQTGLLELDNMLNGGLYGKQFILFAARPGQGKTALMVTTALNMLQAGKSILFISLEMSAEELGKRFVSQITGIPANRIIKGQLMDNEWPVFTNAVEVVEAFQDRMKVVDITGVKISQIRQIVRREHAKRKIDCVFLDYIQLANSDNKNNSRQQDVGEVSRGCKSIAKELDVPLVAGAQLSRDLEKRTEKRPILADLREAGDLEQDSDIVVFIYRPDQYEADTSKRNVAELITAKHRNGSVGSIETVFNGAIMRFENADTKTYKF